MSCVAPYIQPTPPTVQSTDSVAWGNITGTLSNQTDLQMALDAKQSISEKDASNGYVGLSGLKVKMKNNANTFISYLQNTNTASRTYTFQDRSGTIADVARFTAGEPIGYPRVVMVDNGMLYLFDPSDENNYDKIVGVSANAANMGDEVLVYQDNTLYAPAEFATDTTYYAGASGVLTSSVPSSGVQFKIGRGINADNLAIFLNQPVVMA